MKKFKIIIFLLLFAQKLQKLGVGLLLLFLGVLFDESGEDQVLESFFVQTSDVAVHIFVALPPFNRNRMLFHW